MEGIEDPEKLKAIIKQLKPEHFDQPLVFMDICLSVINDQPRIFKPSEKQKASWEHGIVLRPYKVTGLRSGGDG